MHRSQPETQNPNLGTRTYAGFAMGRSLGQILIVLLVLLALVNLPVNYSSAGLAHLLPGSPSIIIRDGMLLQGSGSEIYLLEDQRLRLISSPEAMQRYFGHSHIYRVEDSLLAQLGQGQPIRRLLKCQGKPNVYALENGRKRRLTLSPLPEPVKPWDRVDDVSCNYLASLPTGPAVTTDLETWLQ